MNFPKALHCCFCSSKQLFHFFNQSSSSLPKSFLCYRRLIYLHLQPLVIFPNIFNPLNLFDIPQLSSIPLPKTNPAIVEPKNPSGLLRTGIPSHILPNEHQQQSRFQPNQNAFEVDLRTRIFSWSPRRRLRRIRNGALPRETLLPLNDWQSVGFERQPSAPNFSAAGENHQGMGVSEAEGKRYGRKGGKPGTDGEKSIEAVWMEIPALGEQGKPIDLREMGIWVHGCAFGGKVRFAIVESFLAFI